MKKILLLTFAFLIVRSEHLYANHSESHCLFLVDDSGGPNGGFCGLQFWQPNIQECFSNLKPVGTVCTPAGSICEKPSTCQFGGNFIAGEITFRCTPLGQPALSSKICRASTTLCDLHDRCNGSSLSCPADEVAPDSMLCRSASGACDVSDFCDGSSKSCPDAFVPEGETCRDMDNQCDIGETCDGTSAFCPEDELAGAIECDDGDECTDDDTCNQGQCIGDGIDNCPAEELEPDAGPGGTSDAGTGPNDPDAGVSGESDAGDSPGGEGGGKEGGGCSSVGASSSTAGSLFLFLAVLLWTRQRRRFTAVLGASRE